MEKQQEIISMFDNIADSYDITNRILSCGIDVIWRNKACNLAFQNMQTKDNINIIDVACGTGDMIIKWQENANKNNININNIKGIDPSEKMLQIAQQKIPSVEFIKNEATNMPLESESADIISISYGIRNVVARQEALIEFARILKKGGILVILEFTKNQNPSLLEKCAMFYTKKILPIVGGLVSQNYKAYKYLPDSIEEFLSTQKLNEELKQSGFTPLYTKAFLANICTLFVAKRD